jgi:hypothetical protein
VLKQHLPSRGFVPRRHSTPEPFPVTCTRHRYLSHGKRPGSIPRQDLSSRLVVDPARLTRPSPHTQDTRQDLSMFIIRLLAPHALSHYASHPPASHHRYNASKSRAISSKRASSLTAGVQGNRLRQGNGSQAIYHATYRSSFA